MEPISNKETQNNDRNTNMTSTEHLELQNFAFGLGSYSIAPETDKAEQGTIQEAELLMSLCSSPVHFDKSEIEAISSSESENSYHSDSSSSRRGNFTFVCPSFSLENSEMAMRRIKHNVKIRKSTNGVSQDQISSNGDVPTPAMLLKRPLKVDDRDAYRLSTEAMARNLSRSMQKALDWRIETWIHSLSLQIVKKEKAMKDECASESQMRTLLKTSEAMLITHLRSLKPRMQVTGAGTGFRVLDEKADGREPVIKKRRLSNDGREEVEQLYTVTHELIVDGVINLETPVGYSEVLLQIPGTIKGTFVKTGNKRDTLESVSLDVNTDFLAAMIEKASRKLVRETLTIIMEESSSTSQVQAQEYPEVQESVQTTPPRRNKDSVFSPSAVRAALITPRMNSNDTSSVETPATKYLLPIPDDFNDMTPSRISPQPNSPAFGTTTSSYITPQTPKTDIFNAAAVLVSPPLKESTDYHDVPDNSPSLPMLVEVACREFRND